MVMMRTARLMGLIASVFLSEVVAGWPQRKALRQSGYVPIGAKRDRFCQSWRTEREAEVKVDTHNKVLWIESAFPAIEGIDRLL